MRIYRIAWKEILRTAYLKIYRLASRNLWDNFANKLTSNIFFYIRDNYKNFKTNTETQRKFLSGIEIELVDEKGIEGRRKGEKFKKIVPVYVHVVIMDEIKRWVLFAGGDINQETVDIGLYIRLNRHYLSSRYLPTLSRRIYKAMRHEIEHVRQIKEKTFPKDPGYDIQKIKHPTDTMEDFRERIKYLYAAQELSAFIKSLKGEAIRNEESLVSLIKKFIHGQLFANQDAEKIVRNNIGSEAATIENNIISLYLNKAKIIFPDLNPLYKSRR